VMHVLVGSMGDPYGSAPPPLLQKNVALLGGRWSAPPAASPTVWSFLLVVRGGAQQSSRPYAALNFALQHRMRAELDPTAPSVQVEKSLSQLAALRTCHRPPALPAAAAAAATALAAAATMVSRAVCKGSSPTAKRSRSLSACAGSSSPLRSLGRHCARIPRPGSGRDCLTLPQSP
jgi:hypothetical protein